MTRVIPNDADDIIYARLNPWDEPVVPISTWADVSEYGAIGDGTADDTSAINDAISSVTTTGGTVLFPPGTYKVTESIIPVSSVKLVGMGCFSSSSGSGVEPPVRIVGDGAFAIIDGTGLTVDDFGVENIGFQGSESDSGSRAILGGTAANNWSIRNVFGSGFANQGIYIQSGVAGVYENIWMQRCNLKRADAVTYVGAVQFGDATHYVSDVHGRYIGGYCSYLKASEDYASGYHCGLVLSAPNGVFEFCQGSWSETGIRTVTGLAENLKLANCRGDHNLGHGFDVYGQGALYMGCTALNNSIDTDATYSGFRVHSGGNTFVGNRITETYGYATHHLYGFEDDSDDNKSNIYDASNRCDSTVSGGLYNITTWAAEPLITRANGRMLQLDNPAVMDGVTWSGTGLIVGTGGPCIISGAVDPSAGDGVAAVKGSIFMRTDGAESTSIYIKTDAADTAWTAK